MTQHNLPPQPTSFIGRAQDIADIRARLTDDNCRLLTLIGSVGWEVQLRGERVGIGHSTHKDDVIVGAVDDDNTNGGITTETGDG